MWETICDAQAGFCTVDLKQYIFAQILQKAPFWNFRPESPPPPWKTSHLRWPKFTPEYPNPPPKNEKLQIWDDQSLLRNTPQWKNFRFEMTKVYSGIPPQWKTSDLRWPKFTLDYPPLKKSCWWEFSYVETYIYHTDNILVAMFIATIFSHRITVRYSDG